MLLMHINVSFHHVNKNKSIDTLLKAMRNQSPAIRANAGSSWAQTCDLLICGRGVGVVDISGVSH